MSEVGGAAKAATMTRANTIRYFILNCCGLVISCFVKETWEYCDIMQQPHVAFIVEFSKLFRVVKHMQISILKRPIHIAYVTFDICITIQLSRRQLIPSTASCLSSTCDCVRTLSQPSQRLTTFLTHCESNVFACKVNVDDAFLSSCRNTNIVDIHLQKFYYEKWFGLLWQRVQISHYKESLTKKKRSQLVCLKNTSKVLSFRYLKLLRCKFSSLKENLIY